MTPSHCAPLRFPLVVGVFPLLAGVLFLSLFPFAGGHPRGFGCLGNPVLLPVVEWAPRAPETPHDSHIKVRADGMVFLNSKWYPTPEFPIMFGHIARESLPHAGSRVFLTVDRYVPFGTVRILLHRLRETGIGEATLVVESRSPYGPPPAPNPGVQWTRSARH